MNKIVLAGLVKEKNIQGCGQIVNREEIFEYPEEYKYVTEQEAFTFEDIQDALKDGINIHAYACRTNQEHRYVFLDEEDYTEDSKYYKRWENHKSEIEDKDTPDIYPKFSYII